MVIGVVVAGGQGARVGFKKQYISLAGKPMWTRSVDALLQAGVDDLWLVVPEGDVVEIRGEVAHVWPREANVHVVAGGRERSESVYNAVVGLSGGNDGVGASDLIAIHDAARPFVLATDVKRTVEAAQSVGAAVLGKRCIDTMKQVDDDGTITSTVDRGRLWHALTPQVVRLDWLLACYQSMQANEEVHYTDEASMLEAIGYPIQMIEAAGYNAKVTTKEDLEFAQWWAQKRWGESQ